MKALFVAAIEDFARPKRVWAWLGVVAAVGFVGVLWNRIASDMGPAPASGQLVLVMVYRIVALAAAIFSTMVVSQEIEQRTAAFLLLLPVNRVKILLTRLGAAALCTTVVSVACLLASGLGTLGLQVFGQGPFYRDVGVVTLGSISYCTLFLLFSLVWRRPLVASLLYAFGWETFVPNMAGDLVLGSVMTYMRSLAIHRAPETDPNLLSALAGNFAPRVVEPQTATIALVALPLVLAGLSLLKFRNLEVLPGTQE